MSNVYPLPAPIPFSDAIRTVVMLDRKADGTLSVAGASSAQVRVAVSCLIEPQSGDSVIAMADGQTLWVTDVLTCADPSRPLTLRCAHAALAIEAENLSLRAGRTLAFESPKLTILSRTTRWVAEKMVQVAGHLQTQCRVAERLVSESDTISAEHIQHQARVSYRVDSELTAMNGRSVLKIDGGQVHVG